MQDVATYLHHKWSASRSHWRPFLSVFYLTYACDFRCCYCSDGSGKPYYKSAQPHPSAETALTILTKIRRYTKRVVITGGEPLNHPDFGRIMSRLPDIGFKEVILTTNGYCLDQYLHQISRAVSSLVISLDTLIPERADAINGTPGGTFKKIVANLERADHYHPKKYRILISSVLTPDNIHDLYALYDFCHRKGYLLAVCPQLVGVKVHPDLIENDAYKHFYDFLIARKKRGGLVYGTPLYLKYLRNLRRFHCYPFTMLTISPEGEVFYPCLEIGRSAGNILGDEDLHQLRQKGRSTYGPQPNCGNQCHSACALGFSLIIDHPLSMLQEIYLLLKTFLSPIEGHGKK